MRILKTTLTALCFLLTLFSVNTFAQDFPYISFGGHTERTRGLAFSADGKTLASGSDDKTIIVWEVDTGNKLRQIVNFRLTGGQAPQKVYEVSLNPDGSIVASAGYNRSDWSVRSLRLWEVSTGEMLWQQSADDLYGLGVAFSPDGSTVASGGSDHTVDLWDVSTGDARRTLVGHTDVIARVVFSADGQLLASASNDNTVGMGD